MLAIGIILAKRDFSFKYQINSRIVPKKAQREDLLVSPLLLQNFGLVRDSNPRTHLATQTSPPGEAIRVGEFA